MLVGCLEIGSPLGIGSMMWGSSWLDHKIQGGSPTKEDLQKILQFSQNAGVNFYDSAEGYGGGTCELRLADLTKGSETPVIIGTKFIPTLWRWTEKSFFKSLRGSLERLGVNSIDLYYIHTPVHPLPFEFWVECVCKARQRGFIKEIGLSNCGVAQIKAAISVAEKMGQKIVANQVLYSLLDYNSSSLREMESLCKKHNIVIIAYSVLGQGLLADNLTPEKFKRIRLSKITGLTYSQLIPLRNEIQKLAQKYDKTMSQVCLNWAICKGTIPLVGVRTPEQAKNAMGALGWRLNSEDVENLDRNALPCSTLDKPRWRRAFFVVLISFLILSYYIVNFVERLLRRRH